MTSYEYKVIPAPRQARKVKGVKSADELFAMTLAEAINEVARQDWEFVRTETLTAEAPGGWFRRGTAADHTVMVFRRAREALGPRLAAITPGQEVVRSHQDLPREPELAAPGKRDRGSERSSDRAVERMVVDRLQSTLRQNPVRLEPVGDDQPPAATRRPGPRLGPADHS